MWKNLSAASICIAALTLQACDRIPGTPAFKARQALSDFLIDPDSAKIKVISSSDKSVCGTVNAKNRMGAYVGQQPFIVSDSYPNLIVFDGAPSISDYRSWSSDPKSEYGKAAYDRMDYGCDFPNRWKAQCAPQSSLTFGVDEDFCKLWRSKNWSDLSTEANY